MTLWKTNSKNAFTQEFLGKNTRVFPLNWGNSIANKCHQANNSLLDLNAIHKQLKMAMKQNYTWSVVMCSNLSASQYFIVLSLLTEKK